MPSWASWTLNAAAAYLLGGIPFGLLLSRCKGVDVRKTGSGNIGATNVFRSVSRPLGVLTFGLDAFKGFVPAHFLPILGNPPPSGFQPLELPLLFGALAMIGHMFPPYLRGRGGKGIATGAGVLLAVMPKVFVAGLLAWLLLFLLTRYVSVASLGAALVVGGVGSWLLAETSPRVAIALVVLVFLAIWQHRSNIARLVQGTEHRFTPSSASSAERRKP